MPTERLQGERDFDLKLQAPAHKGCSGGTGRMVTWSGTDELNAARNYVASHRGAVVIATRPHHETNVVCVLARGYRISEPGDRQP